MDDSKRLAITAGLYPALHVTVPPTAIFVSLNPKISVAPIMFVTKFTGEAFIVIFPPAVTNKREVISLSGPKTAWP
jgi:hypothetical protein